MRISYLIIISFSILFSSCNQNNKKVKDNQAQNKKTEKLDSLYTDLFNQNKFNGNVLIAEDGKILLKKSYGLADAETKVDLNENSIFELASVSKQFTAMGIVQLVKEGKINYGDDIRKYIPELSFYNKITIENLLYHTSGLPDYIDLADLYWDKEKIANNDDIVKLFELHKPELFFETNSDYEYSNTGYLLLATIIERTSDLNYQDYLKNKVFIPSNMKSTLVLRKRYEPKEMKNIAIGYLYSDSLKTKVKPDNLTDYKFVTYLDGVVGDGMVNSTTQDLYNWDRVLRNEKIINQTDKERIFQPYKFFDSIPTGYGYGWYIIEDEKFGKYVKHSGGWPGYVAHIERHLDTDKTIIILQNLMLESPLIPLKNTRNILYNLPLDD
ncbi:serine hydrolase domain-containing protein [uncultured Cyclobacterium sp.]|uniref:serine hydrolase domain-containing protein n=1 Tax=uncultured Cyclobacterium sp. TaxID=453820 RepID=UPI0030EEF1FA|tara:strand:+ start:343 stop:1491 length:1149 start_codon:yes stop_codon:yes gene_type:complete